VTVVRPAELVPVLKRTAEAEALLDGRSVAVVANVLINPNSSNVRSVPARAGHLRGQALVEFACALVVLLVLAFGLLGVARVTGELLGITAVAREAARAGARAPDQTTALAWASDRGQQVAAEYGLANVGLDIDTSSFEVQPSAGVVLPGEIRVAATVTVDLSDVPLVSWVEVQVPLVRRFAEVVDPYRSAPPPPDGGGA
jgi:Flp pilus assembly protein TadG